MKHHSNFDGMLLRAGIAALLLGLAACGGGGGSEEEAPAPPPLQPTLNSIQANIFTPTCAISGCHTGANAMLGLRLDAGSSYTSLVGVPSFYGTGLIRVVAGDSDNSFLIEKLGPNPVFGDSMPFMGSPLPFVYIDAIRQWIDNGAQP